MDLSSQRRMAAELLKCGVHRVWFDMSNVEWREHIGEAVTRKDIRQLIHFGLIRKKQIRGITQVRIKHHKAQRAKGRRRGHGSRKGTATARFPSKKRWMATIRPLRRDLKVLRDKGVIERSVYRVYYRKAKGGEFRTPSQLHQRLVARGILKEADVALVAKVRKPSGRERKAEATGPKKVKAAKTPKTPKVPKGLGGGTKAAKGASAAKAAKDKGKAPKGGE